ncbi:MAG TPA: hypothetical protein VL201_05110, partial [Patescibacteria group bacterium]|nr:hypothetical protein [Patescibacteria group bacterium]
DYIKKYVSIKPYVFVEDYIRRHTFSDEVAKNTLQNKVLLLMDEMKEYDSEKYIGCVLTLLQNYHVSSNQAFKKERNRKKALSHKDQEHVASQPDSMTIDETITEALAAKNDTLQKKIISKECCDKFYQATIVILTLITVIVPIVQPLWGGHSSAMPAPCFNMSL